MACVHGCLSQECSEWLVNHPVITPGTWIGRKLLRVGTRQAPISTKGHTLQFRQRLRHGTIYSFFIRIDTHKYRSELVRPRPRLHAVVPRALEDVLPAFGMYRPSARP
jgi:hypothetical protein